MNSNQLLGLAEELVTYGRKHGASQAEVSIRQATAFSVDVREQEIEKLTEAGSNGLSLRVFVDGRMARASSSDLSRDTLHRLVGNAIERARLSSPDPLAGLPENTAVPADAAALKIHDPALLAMTPEAKIAAARQTEAICLADKRINKSFGASFRTTAETLFLANSNGISASYARTHCSNSVYLQSGEGSNLFDEGWGDESTALATLESPEEIAKKAIHRTTRLIGGRKVPSQNVPVVFEPPMTGSLLSFLVNCVSGNSVYLRQSFLAGRLGQKIGNELVTVVDDGRMPGGIGTKPFDQEGVPTRKTVVVDKGVLTSYLMDTYAGRKLGQQATGHASGANNLYLAAGTSHPADIIRSVDKGLFLTGTIGFGLVPTTGDISRGAFGLWIEKGEFAFPVAEITISGNLGQILREIEMVGNDLTHKESVTGPTIKVAEMTVGGK